MSTSSKTGLPELPDGYFWRVSNGSSSAYLRVQIMERRRFGSHVAEWSACEASAVDHRGASEILSTAEYVLRKWRGPDAKDIGVSRLLGDYPPKTLT